MDPKVFYGPLKDRAERPPDSDTETEIEESPKKFKRLHKRTDSERQPRKKTKDTATAPTSIDISSRAGQKELVRRSNTGDLAFVGKGLELGWIPTPEALVSAASGGHSELLGMLLAFGSGDASWNGQTPLSAAISGNHTEVVQLLVNADVSLSWKDKNGRGYRDLAENSSSAVRKVLLEAYVARREKRKQRDERRESFKEKTRPKSIESKDPSKPTHKAILKKDRKPEHGIKDTKDASHDVSRVHDVSKVPRESKDLKDMAKPAKDASEAEKPLKRVETAPAATSNGGSATTRTSADEDRPRRKTFSLSDYKNLKFTKAKREAEQKNQEGAKAAADKKYQAERAVKAKADSESATKVAEEETDREVKRYASSAEEAASKAEADSQTIQEASESKKVESKPVDSQPKEPAQKAVEPTPQLPATGSSAPATLSPEVNTSAENPAASGLDEGGVSELAEPIKPVAEAAVKSTPTDSELNDRDVPMEVDSSSSGSTTTAPSEPTVSRESRVKFKDPRDILERAKTPVREVSHSPKSPAQSPVPTDAQQKAINEKRNEERKAMEALLAKRERERKAREAQMLEKLANEEKRRKSEKSDQTEPSDVPAVKSESKEPSRASTPVKSPRVNGEVAKLPYILRRLAYSGERQPQVAPLFAHKYAGSVNSFEKEPSRFHCLDIQVGAYLGIPIHLKYPDLIKTQVTKADKLGLWEFISSWVCPVDCAPAVKEEEFAKFNELPLYWLRGDDVVRIMKDHDELEFNVVPIALQVPNNEPVDSVLLELAKSMPIHMAAKAVLHQVYTWD